MIRPRWISRRYIPSGGFGWRRTLNKPRLFEFLDFARLPNSLRDAATDDLRFKWQRGGLYKPIAARLTRLLAATGGGDVLDLASGGGGPIWAAYRQMVDDGVDLKVTLSDKFPNLPAFAFLKKISDGGIDFVEEPLDVTAIPPELEGIRTLCASAHHFRLETLTAILQDAVDRGRPIAIFDASAPPTPPPPMMFLFCTPPGVLLSALFIRPFRWSRLFWTFVLPLLPLLILWDAQVSWVRAYSVKQLEGIVRELQPNDYVWEIGRESFPNTITYLTGYPAPTALGAT